MKRLLITATMFLVAAGCGTAQMVAQAADPDMTLARAVAGVAAAQDAAAAQTAYAAGAAVDLNNLQLNRTYLRRAVDLGAPEAAYVQARIVEAQSPADGLALAVIAYAQASGGDVTGAMSNIVAAVGDSPKDPFVLRIAGQLTAWLDQKPSEVTVPDYVRDAMVELAGQLARQQDFADGYAEAKAAYKELAAAEAQAAAAPLDPADGSWTTAPLPDATAAANLEAFTPDEAAGELSLWAAATPSVTVQVGQQPVFADVQYAQPYFDDTPIYSQTIVNVYNYFYLPPPCFAFDGRWHHDRVVFLGCVRRDGLLLGRFGHRDVVVDHSRNVYLGDARNGFARGAGNVVISHARRIGADPDRRLVTTRAPRTLLADNRGAILASRIEKPPVLRPSFGTGRGDRPADRKVLSPLAGMGPVGQGRNLLPARDGGSFPRAGVANPSTPVPAFRTREGGLTPSALPGRIADLKPLDRAGRPNIAGPFRPTASKPILTPKLDVPARPTVSVPPPAPRIERTVTPGTLTPPARVETPIRIERPAFTPPVARLDPPARPTVSVPPPAPRIERKVIPSAPPARVETPARIERTTVTPPARVERPTFTPPARVEAPARVERPTFTPPAPTRVEAPAASSGRSGGPGADRTSERSSSKGRR